LFFWSIIKFGELSLHPRASRHVPGGGLGLARRNVRGGEHLASAPPLFSRAPEANPFVTPETSGTWRRR